MRHNIVKAENKYGLRKCCKTAVVQRFNTNYMKLLPIGDPLFGMPFFNTWTINKNFKSFFNIVTGKSILENISFEALSRRQSHQERARIDLSTQLFGLDFERTMAELIERNVISFWGKIGGKMARYTYSCSWSHFQALTTRNSSH